MGKLVGNNISNTFLGLGRRIFLIEQEVDRSVRNQPPVLHSARRKFCDGDLVQFGKRIGNVKVRGEELKDAGSNVEGEAALLLEPWGRVGSHDNRLGARRRCGVRSSF